MARDDSEVDVLLVEDNPNDAELTMRALRASVRSERFMHAEDGVKALGLLFEDGGAARLGKMPRMILLDLKLPKLDGLGVLKRLRAEERTRTLPVVVLTSSSQDADVIASYNLGANSYVRKPVEFGAFVEAVSSLGLYWVLLNRPPPMHAVS